MHLQKYEQKLGELYDTGQALGCGRGATEEHTAKASRLFSIKCRRTFPKSREKGVCVRIRGP